MLRNKESKDNVPGPVYMDQQQMSNYLSDLRSNRPTRPTGARPPPPSIRSARQSIHVSSMVDVPEDQAEQDASVSPVKNARSTRKVSDHRKSYSTSQLASVPSRLSLHLGRPIVKAPSAYSTDDEDAIDVTCQESGDRFMEKQEARSLRLALQEMDIAEEQRLFEAAKREAAQLVWKHQNPSSPTKDANAPMRYRRHSQRLSSGDTPVDVQNELVVPKNRTDVKRTEIKVNSGSRSASDSSDSAASTGSTGSTGSRSISDGSMKSDKSDKSNDSSSSKLRRKSMQFASNVIKKSEEKLNGVRKISLKKAFSTTELKSDLPQSQSQKKSKSESEPQSLKLKPSMGSVHARNPFSRVRNARSSIVKPETHDIILPDTPYLERVEIQRNPPTQSRNAQYTKTPPLPVKSCLSKKSQESLKTKNGKEVRDKEIRKATSMTLKDRSSKLITPTVVTISADRPIVSFEDDWQPKDVVENKDKPNSMVTTKPVDRHGDHLPITAVPAPPAMSLRTNTFPPALIKSQPLNAGMPLPTIILPDVVGTSRTYSAPAIPTICISDEPTQPQRTDTTPSITLSEAPAISIFPPAVSVSAQPTISISAPPSISIQAPQVPSICLPDNNDSSSRPLPTPGRTKKQRPLWAVPTQATARSSVLCNECAVPIAGRIVTAAGARFHPGCFRCHHCSEALECVAFFPEPSNKRAERLAATPAFERDDGLRFFCHLDYHEFFSPRCKSCKTPIEGDVIVACGAEWHAGHFFCAQCGDPFEQNTPFVEKDGYAWCVNCHTNRFSTKCHGCRKPVVDMVVSALGHEWHEDCFCCKECEGKFEDGRYFLREGEEDAVCPGCEERRLKA